MKFFKILIFNLLLSLMVHIRSESFNNIWSRMQYKFSILELYLSNQNFEKSKFFTSFWYIRLNNLRSLLQGPVDYDFRAHPDILETMVRGPEAYLSYEEDFLTNYLSEFTKKKIIGFKDDDVQVAKVSKVFNYSANTVGHLYDACRILDHYQKDPEVIVELGGGYGNLAKIFKQILPEVTIIIFDAPEVNAIQYLFLSKMLPRTKIFFDIEPINDFSTIEKGSIYLVPIFFLTKCKIKANIFVSTFAITETPKFVQEQVIKKRFFNSDLCYITGDVSDVGLIKNSLESFYKTINYQRSHIVLKHATFFELMTY